jgi:hypothetical protein
LVERRIGKIVAIYPLNTAEFARGKAGFANAGKLENSVIKITGNKLDIRALDATAMRFILLMDLWYSARHNSWQRMSKP